MKKIFTLTALFIAITFIAKAQISTEQNDEGKALYDNDVLFDVYYGYAIPGVFLASINALEGGTNYAGNPYSPKTSVLGPVGLRVQYMVSNSFGIGIDANYEQKTGTWQGSEYQTDENGNGYYVDSEGKYQVTKLKVMIRGSWEFVNTERFNMNWANSIGYKAGKRTFIDPEDDLGLSFSSGLVPVAIRSALGARFFLTPNIALNTEIGIFGGGLLVGGLTYKL